METALPDGGRIVTAVGTVPPVGTVMVFAPEARVLISTEPALEALVEAETVWVPITSPEKVIVWERVDVTAIIGKSLLLLN